MEAQMRDPSGETMREDDNLEDLSSSDSAPRTDADSFNDPQLAPPGPGWMEKPSVEQVCQGITALIRNASPEERVVMDKIIASVEKTFNVKFDASFRPIKNSILTPNLDLSSMDAAHIGARLLSCASQLRKGILPRTSLLAPLLNILTPSAIQELRRSNADINSAFTELPKPVLDRKVLLESVLNPDSSHLYDRYVSLPEEVRTVAQLVLRFEKFKDAHASLLKSFSRVARLGSLESAYSAVLLENIRNSHSTGDVKTALSEVLMSDAGSKVKSLHTSRSEALFTTLRKLRRARGDVPFTMLSKMEALRRELPCTHREIMDVDSRKKDIAQLAKHVANRVATIESRRTVLEEKEKKERLRLLRENDMDKYRQLVSQTKNRRLCELLDQTEKFLEQIGSRIEIEKEASTNIRDKQAAEEAAAAKREADRKAARAAARRAARGENPLAAESPEKDEDVGAMATTTAGDEKATDEVETKKQTYYTVTHGVKEGVKQPACLVGGKLMSYQMQGLEFLVSLYNNNISGILADEMGLGKTIQTIALLAYLREVKGVNGPHLVAVPLSTLPNWANEFDKWCPDLKVLQYRGTKEERRVLNEQLKKRGFNVLLTTFDFILREKRVLSYPRWKFIIVDEGHRMKNVRSKFHTTLGEFRSTHRLLLTGTPLQNNLQELWSLMHFLLPCTFSSAEDFERWFEEPFRDGLPGADSKDVALTEEEKMLVINRLHAVLRPFLLRRIKADVLQDLPQKKEYVVRIELSKWQKTVYEQLVQKTLNVKDASGNISKKSVQNSVMQLRKVVNHPYLFRSEYKMDHDLFRTAGKFEVLDRMLPKLLKFKHRVLIFCQMTQVMDILADYMEVQGYKYHRLDGSVNVQDRQDRMDDFNRPDSDTFVFMLSTRAGSLGLNLQAADTVILFDSDWNPHQDLQAQARAHRVGQKNEVRVFRFVTISGVEELVLAKAQFKLNIDEQIIQAGMFSNKYSEEEREDRLRKLLSQKELEQEVRVTTPPELNRFMARSPQEEDAFMAIDKELFGDKYFREIYDADEESDVASEVPASAEWNDTSSYLEGTSVSPTPPSESSDTKSGIVTRSSRTKASVKTEESTTTTQFAAVHAAQVKRSGDKMEALLIASGRLIRQDEVPAELLIKIEDNIDAETGMPIIEGPRKTKLRDGASYSSLLSEAAFCRAMEKYEDGEFASFEDACAEEGKKALERRQGRRFRDAEASNDESDESVADHLDDDQDFVDERAELEDVKPSRRALLAVKTEEKVPTVSPVSAKRKRSTVVGTDEDSAVGKKKRTTEPRTMTRQSSRSAQPVLETPPKKEPASGNRAKPKQTVSSGVLSPEDASGRRKRRPAEVDRTAEDNDSGAPNSKRKIAAVLGASHGTRRQAAKGK